MSESYMEKALVKLARQLNAYDEASLMSLWEKYAEKVRHFEPTKRWEEAVLVFNLIQSTRLKNQLFNFNWAQSRMPGEPHPDVDLAALTAPGPTMREVPKSRKGAASDSEAASTSSARTDRKGKLLTLQPKKKK